MPAWYCLDKSAALLLSSLGGFSRLTEVGGGRQEEEMMDETKVKPLPSLRGLQSNHAVVGQCKHVCCCRHCTSFITASCQCRVRKLIASHFEG